MDYGKTAAMLYDEGKEEEAFKVLDEGMSCYTSGLLDLFNATPYFSRSLLIVAAERICKFLRGTDNFVNGQADKLDKGVGDRVSDSLSAVAFLKSRHESDPQGG